MTFRSSCHSTGSSLHTTCCFSQLISQRTACSLVWLLRVHLVPFSNTLLDIVPQAVVKTSRVEYKVSLDNREKQDKVSISSCAEIRGFSRQLRPQVFSLHIFEDFTAAFLQPFRRESPGTHCSSICMQQLPHEAGAAFPAFRTFSRGSIFGRLLCFRRRAVLVLHCSSILALWPRLRHGSGEVPVRARTASLHREPMPAA